MCNLFAEIASFTDKYIADEDECVVELIYQAAEFLTEVMQGPCEENQRFLCAGDLLLNCSRALNSVTELVDIEAAQETFGFTSEYPVPQQMARCEVRTKIVTVCQAMIEAARNSTTPRVVISKLEASIMVRIILICLSSMPSRNADGYKVLSLWIRGVLLSRVGE